MRARIYREGSQFYRVMALDRAAKLWLNSFAAAEAYLWFPGQPGIRDRYGDHEFRILSEEVDRLWSAFVAAGGEIDTEQRRPEFARRSERAPTAGTGARESDRVAGLATTGPRRIVCRGPAVQAAAAEAPSLPPMWHDRWSAHGIRAAAESLRWITSLWFLSGFIAAAAFVDHMISRELFYPGLLGLVVFYPAHAIAEHLERIALFKGAQEARRVRRPAAE